MASLDVPLLSGSLVRLEPLSVSHVPDLTAAVEEDRIAYGYTWVPRAAEVGDYVSVRLGRSGLTPFAQVRLADRKAVGCTALPASIERRKGCSWARLILPPVPDSCRVLRAGGRVKGRAAPAERHRRCP